MILIDANWQTIANQGNYCSLDLILSSSANQIHSELTLLPSLQLPDTGNNNVGIVELCAKILQIMRNDFKDYARTFCQLCAPFSIQISINQERK